MEVPKEQARLQDLDNDKTPKPAKTSSAQSAQENPAEPVATSTDFEDPENQTPEKSGEKSAETEGSTEKSAGKSDNANSSDEPKEKAPAKRSLIEIAKWVIQNEARKVGAACNFFIQRIFTLMGFGKADWTANDFAQYVKSNFSHFRQASFYGDRGDLERKRLKEYIWSFPEKTGLIFQWKRESGHGHIAVVQRVDDQLVIYHASLNTFIPKAQRVSLEVLLDASRKNLNVFSDFKK